MGYIKVVEPLTWEEISLRNFAPTTKSNYKRLIENVVHKYVYLPTFEGQHNIISGVGLYVSPKYCWKVVTTYLDQAQLRDHPRSCAHFNKLL